MEADRTKEPRQSEPTVNESARFIQKLDTCEGMAAKLILLKNFMLRFGIPKEPTTPLRCPTCKCPHNLPSGVHCTNKFHVEEPTAPTAQDFCADMIANLRANVKKGDL